MAFFRLVAAVIAGLTIASAAAIPAQASQSSAVASVCGQITQTTGLYAWPTSDRPAEDIAGGTAVILGTIENGRRYVESTRQSGWVDPQYVRATNPEC